MVSDSFSGFLQTPQVSVSCKVVICVSKCAKLRKTHEERVTDYKTSEQNVPADSVLAFPSEHEGTVSAGQRRVRSQN